MAAQLHGKMKDRFSPTWVEFKDYCLAFMLLNMKSSNWMMQIRKGIRSFHILLCPFPDLVFRYCFHRYELLITYSWSTTALENTLRILTKEASLKTTKRKRNNSIWISCWGCRYCPQYCLAWYTAKNFGTQVFQSTSTTVAKFRALY